MLGAVGAFRGKAVLALAFIYLAGPSVETWVAELTDVDIFSIGVAVRSQGWDAVFTRANVLLASHGIFVQGETLVAGGATVGAVLEVPRRVYQLVRPPVFARVNVFETEVGRI